MKHETKRALERKTVSIRNVSAVRWDAIQKKAKDEGIAVWKMLDEAFDYVLAKK